MNAAFQLSLLYGGMFLVVGIMMPFWPVWLEAKGLTPPQIGLVIAAGSLIRAFVGPLSARFADRTGERKRLMAILSTLSFIFFMPFAIVDSFAAILILQACLIGVMGPIMPLSESLTMLGAKRHGLDYGRIRLWGSLTFILGASGVGYYLKGAEPDLIWQAIAIAIALYALGTYIAPDFRSTPSPKSEGPGPITRVLTDKTFVVFVAATACIQGSHALLYSFGTINWLRMGFSEGVIGLLWAEGVLAEVILFVFAANAIKRIGPARLIALGGLACLLRWSMTPFAESLWAIAALQIMHAFTFGTTHLGAIYFIADRMPEEISATAQTLYALIVSGFGLGLISVLSGHLYEDYAGDAFFAMAIFGGIGMLLAWSIRRRHPVH